MKRRTRTQSGNAVILILIGVALFAALSYTFMRGGQQGQGNLTAQQTKIVAQEIINYSNQVDRTVQKLLQKGCSETQISFEHSPFDGSDTDYANPNSPLDFSCHIFHANGGGVTEPDVPSGAGTNASYIYSADNAISGIGGSNNDLALLAYNVDPSLCLYMNNLIWNFNSIPTDNGSTGDSPFAGDLTINGVQIFTSSGNPSNGQTSACIRGGANIGGVYFYYRVLIAR